MDLSEAIRRRTSVRSFLPREVGDGKVHRILEAGLSAPSSNNGQPWRFIVVKDAGKRKALADATRGQKFLADAPVIIVACGVDTDRVMTCGQPAYTVDVSIAVDHMTLAAANEGLGTCWVCAFHEDKAKKVVNVPEDARIVALLPMGYPAGDPPATPRHPFESLVAVDSWPDTWGGTSSKPETEAVSVVKASETKAREVESKPAAASPARESKTKAPSKKKVTAKESTPKKKVLKPSVKKDAKSKKKTTAGSKTKTKRI